MRLICFTFLICCSCTMAQYRGEEYISSYQRGALAEAQSKVTQSIQKEMPQDDFRRSKDAVCLLLDKATIYFASGEIDEAIADYKLAIEALDYYNQDAPIEMLSKTLLEDSWGAYPGADFEQVLARLYFALALMQQGDHSNAYALLRQGEELQQKKREIYRQTSFTKDYQLIDNAVAKYLFASLLESRGDISNANIIYREVATILGLDHLEQPQHADAKVLILCHNGNAPYKVSTVSHASIASAAALEILLSSRIRPAYSSLTGIPTPALFQNYSSLPQPVFVNIDGHNQELKPWYNVSAVAHKQLEQEIPVIAARGVARFILRRSAVAYAQRQDPCLGAIADIGMLIVNANTQADTRSWKTLPSTIDLACYNLCAGEHSLSIDIKTALPPYSYQNEFCLQLSPHDLCVINIFNIHPGVTQVLIPQKFLRRNLL